MSRIVRPAATVEYPSGDGQPMAENDWQLLAIINSVSALQHHYRDRPDVCVSGDLFIYYEEGNPRARVAPDVFVAFGVPSHKRPSYKLWEEGVVPAFVMEVASAGTWREDDGRKAKLYERLGVQEYWAVRPDGGVSRATSQGPSPGGRGVRAADGGGVDRRDAAPSEARRWNSTSG